MCWSFGVNRSQQSMRSDDTLYCKLISPQCKCWCAACWLPPGCAASRLLTANACTHSHTSSRTRTHLDVDVVVQLAGCQQVVLHHGPLEHSRVVWQQRALVRLERAAEGLDLIPVCVIVCRDCVCEVRRRATRAARRLQRYEHSSCYPPAQYALQVHLLQVQEGEHTGTP